MRVLHVSTVEWQATEAIAGACRELAHELDDITSFLVVNADPGTAASAFAGVRVIRGWPGGTTYRRAFARVCRELEPDLVHLHGGALAPLLAWAPTLRRVPVVVSAYSPVTTTPRSASGPRSLLEHRANASPLRVAIERTGGAALSRRALRAGRVRVVCTPDERVATAFASSGPVMRVRGAARASKLRASWSATPTVVFAGRAQTGRGVDDLIDAFTIVRSAIPRARLRILLLPGGAAERWRARLEGKPWADILVGASRGLAEEFAAAQVGAFPFRWSATLTPALAAAEAMAVGLPVVATTVDCLTPLVEPEVNGALVAPNDPRALGDALVDVLRAREVWERLSEGAVKTIEGPWSWAGAAEATRRAYELALGQLALGQGDMP